MIVEPTPARRAVQVWGVPIEVPQTWRDQSIFTFRAPVAADGSGSAATLSMMRLESRSLEEAIDNLKLPQNVEALTVLSVGRRPDLGIFEQVLRFKDAETDTAVQQAVRLFEAGNWVYAFSVTSPGPDFADAYVLLSRVQRDFVAAVAGGDK